MRVRETIERRKKRLEKEIHHAPKEYNFHLFSPLQTNSYSQLYFLFHIFFPSFSNVRVKEMKKKKN